MPEVVAALSQMVAIGELRRYPGPVLLFKVPVTRSARMSGGSLAAAANVRLVVVPRRGHIDVIAETATLAGLVATAAASAASQPSRGLTVLPWGGSTVRRPPAQLPLVTKSAAVRAGPTGPNLPIGTMDLAKFADANDASGTDRGFGGD
jgi:hypothetical protein